MIIKFLIEVKSVCIVFFFSRCKCIFSSFFYTNYAFAPGMRVCLYAIEFILCEHLLFLGPCLPRRWMGAKNRCTGQMRFFFFLFVDRTYAHTDKALPSN